MFTLRLYIPPSIVYARTCCKNFSLDLCGIRVQKQKDLKDISFKRFIRMLRNMDNYIDSNNDTFFHEPKNVNDWRCYCKNKR